MAPGMSIKANTVISWVLLACPTLASGRGNVIVPQGSQSLSPPDMHVGVSFHRERGIVQELHQPQQEDLDHSLRLTDVYATLAHEPKAVRPD